jgi:hypothetical protein
MLGAISEKEQRFSLCTQRLCQKQRPYLGASPGAPRFMGQDSGNALLLEPRYYPRGDGAFARAINAFNGD